MCRKIRKFVDAALERKGYAGSREMTVSIHPALTATRAAHLSSIGSRINSLLRDGGQA